jgi:hypothetical protein
MAPPIGIEPMTNWLTARRSTELSYGGKAEKHMNCSSNNFYFTDFDVY